MRSAQKSNHRDTTRGKQQQKDLGIKSDGGGTPEDAQQSRRAVNSELTSKEPQRKDEKSKERHGSNVGSQQGQTDQERQNSAESASKEHRLGDYVRKPERGR